MKYCYYLLPLLLIFYGACEKSRISARSGLIGEAETWFIQHHAEKTAITTADGKDISIKKTPLWEKATSKAGTAGGKVIIVPLKYDGPMGVAKRGQTNLIIEKDSEGKFTALIAKGIGTKGYLGKSRGGIYEKDFTGVALFYDWAENFQFGYQYRNGKVGGYISDASSKQAFDPLAANGAQMGSPSLIDHQANVPYPHTGTRNAMPNFYEDLTGHRPTNAGQGNIASAVAMRQQICFTLITSFYQQVTVGSTTFPPQLIRTDVQNVCWDPHLVEEIDWIAPEPGGTGYMDTTSYVDLTTQWAWPPNPVDGQTASYVNIYGETVSFTYSTELGGWMASTMVIIKGLPAFNSTITNQPPQFASGVLLAMAAPALAEPTPVGEIVVAATAIVLGTIWLVRMADYLIEETISKERIRDECLELYVQCYNKYEFTKPCHTCQQYCLQQNGNWDNLNCPLP